MLEENDAEASDRGVDEQQPLEYAGCKRDHADVRRYGSREDRGKGQLEDDGALVECKNLPCVATNSFDSHVDAVEESAYRCGKRDTAEFRLLRNELRWSACDPQQRR